MRRKLAVIFFLALLFNGLHAQHATALRLLREARKGIESGKPENERQKILEAIAIGRKSAHDSLLADAYDVMFLCQENLNEKDSCYYYLRLMYSVLGRAGMPRFVSEYYLQQYYLHTAYYNDNSSAMRFVDTGISISRMEYRRNKFLAKGLGVLLYRKIEALADPFYKKGIKMTQERRRAADSVNAIILEISGLTNEKGIPFWKERVATYYSYWGEYYRLAGNVDSAIYYKELELNDHLAANRVRMIAFSWGAIGELYSFKGETGHAVKCVEKGLAICSANHLSKETRDNLTVLSRIYVHSGNYKDAYDVNQRFINYLDSMSINDLEQARKNYSIELKQQKLRQDLAINAERSRLQQVYILLAVIVVVLLSVFAVIVVLRYRESHRQRKVIAHQKAVVDQKNAEIIDSISYARRIQQAKLPTAEEISKSLPCSFVLYKPKDIVSGDFYYLRDQEEVTWIAAADCTGHGVPGAIMSMIGSERLDDAFRTTADPGQILVEVNRGMKRALQQNRVSGATRDGMDIALCALNTHTGQLQFAGANRPLWVYRHASKQIEEIKPDKKAIGGFTEDGYLFITHELQLEKGDMFYLFTDGYADTFSGLTDKKLTTRRFRERLLAVAELPAAQQLSELDNFIEEWKHGIEQVDDILVIGAGWKREI